MNQPYGGVVVGTATSFRVRSPAAEQVLLCLFDADGTERQVPMARDGVDWVLEVPGDLSGHTYGYRARGAWEPDQGLWFDEAKLLVDPYAIELDRRFVQHPVLAQFGVDTAHLVPRAVVQPRLAALPKAAPRFNKGGLIYEINVRGFTMLHPDVPQDQRGTVAALAHPAVIAHLRKLGVSAVELMPIVAWIDERHLPPLGLANAWGYNPVVPMALDPGLCPGGVAELRDTVTALHQAGIGVLLDLVLNHTGESDVMGGVLCLRGLDDSAHAKAPDGRLINDTGCGNTLDFGQPWVRDLALDTLRHFVRHCGVDGFRFDLATVMARSPGFDPAAPIFAAIAADPLLNDRVLIAEPWDIGPGGYQLGHFPPTWLEWNDRFRDDVRRFWKGEAAIGTLAMRLSGSSDLFGDIADTGPRTVNFLAAHDGFTLADTVAYAQRHNYANGEDNRDGHGENHSWNHGAEGPSDDPAILAARDGSLRAMLATLFASTGTIMLTAGDEFGRSQRGNNNAYCQDNAIGWIDWNVRDMALEDYTSQLSAMRKAGRGWFAQAPHDRQWHLPGGGEISVADWESPASDGFVFAPVAGGAGPTITVSRTQRMVAIDVP